MARLGSGMGRRKPLTKRRRIATVTYRNGLWLVQTRARNKPGGLLGGAGTWRTISKHKTHAVALAAAKQHNIY